MIKNKIILIFAIMFFLIPNSYAAEKLKNCDENKNLIKKYSCKANNLYKKQTSEISSKKTLVDFFKKKKQ